MLDKFARTGCSDRDWRLVGSDLGSNCFSRATVSCNEQAKS